MVDSTDALRSPAGQSVRTAQPLQRHSEPDAHDPPPHLLNRRQEPKVTYFRCGRYFTVGHEWYVTVREGLDIGPCISREAAELALARYVATCCLSAPRGTASLDNHGDREPTTFELLVREFLECWEQRQLRSANCAYAGVKRRLDALYRKPVQETADIRHAKVLESLLAELDGEVTGPAPAIGTPS